jgi:hypothetical protein
LQVDQGQCKPLCPSPHAGHQNLSSPAAWLCCSPSEHARTRRGNDMHKTLEHRLTVAHELAAFTCQRHA